MFLQGHQAGFVALTFEQMLLGKRSEETKSRFVPLEQLDNIGNASCLTLLFNAVLVWSTMAITK
jgi:hypothetical protein